MASPSGLLLLDKPRGPTSHDVVARARRALGTREVGHGGTLDPMATGLLVVLVGVATRLEPYVSVGDKTYEATVRVGVGTDTLDADGVAVAASPPPPDAEARLAAALDAERARDAQVPPSVSAIHVDGRRAHERVRAGEAVVLSPRAIAVRGIRLGEITRGDAWLDVSLTVTASKGYYVRALARDLGARLGAPAHLTRLRRLASGPLRVEDAVALDRLDPARLLPLTAAVAALMPTRALTEEGALRARQGKILTDADFVDPPADGVTAWLLSGEIVAVGLREGDSHRVARGFPWVSTRAPSAAAAELELLDRSELPADAREPSTRSQA